MVLLLAIIIQVCQAADAFQLTSIFVTDWTVFAETDFNYQLQINRGSNLNVKDGDYLIIQIPTDTSAQWNTLKAPNCTVSNGGSAQKCEILDLYTAKITFNY